MIARTTRRTLRAAVRGAAGIPPLAAAFRPRALADAGRTPALAAGIRAAALAVALGGAAFLLAGCGGEEAGARGTAGEMGAEGGMQEMGGMAMGGGTVRLSPDEIRTFGVVFGTAEVRPLEKRIRAVGLVEFDETRMAYVSPKFGGWAERLYVDFTGRFVRRGEPLLEVYSPELVAAQEDLRLARELADSLGGSPVPEVAAGSESLLEAAVRRLSYWDIPEEEIREILESGEVRRTLVLRSPVPGIVMEKNVFRGQAFRPGANLYMIADLSTVWVNAEVFESDVALLREGMPAEVTVAAVPGEVLRGRVEYIYPTLDRKTRSLRARVSLPNPGATLKPGMYATVRLHGELGEVLAVPEEAVLHTGERAVAFVDMGGGRLMPHELVLGAHGHRYVQMLEGLEPGQRVVTSAQFILDAESNLAEVMRAMMAQMNMSDMGGMDMGGMDVDTAEPMEGMEMPGAADTTGRR